MKKKRKNKKSLILIVDNEPLSLDLTEKFLRLGNFETITSSNAEETMKVVEGRFTDISLIDYLYKPTRHFDYFKLIRNMLI